MRRPLTPECTPDDHVRRAASHGRLDDAAFERAAAIFRAAGDVVRLKLLQRLLQGEWCVTELAEAVGISMSGASQQLRILRVGHLVARRRQHKHIYYVLADQHVADLVQGALQHASEHGGPLRR